MSMVLFYGAAAIALFCSLMVVTRLHPVHALLYLVVAQLAISVIFFLLGAPFAAVLEVLVYAGAVMVMFIFVIMMLNLGPHTAARERSWIAPGIWIGPGFLSGALLAELLTILASNDLAVAHYIDPKTLGIALFGPYLLAVELASMLLLSALVGAYHLSRPYLQARGLPTRTADSARSAATPQAPDISGTRNSANTASPEGRP